MNKTNLTPMQFLEEFAEELVQATDTRPIIRGYAKHMAARETSLARYKERRVKKILRSVSRLLPAAAVTLGSVFIFGGHASAITPDEVFNSVNNVRIQNDVKPLKVNFKLQKSATARAKDLCYYNYFDHVSPIGKRTADFVAEAGYDYQKTGENLAEGFTTTQDAVSAWVASPSHYKNIIDSQYTETGVAILDCSEYRDKDTSTIIVQHFGNPDTQSAGSHESSKLPIDIWVGVGVIVILLIIGMYIEATNNSRRK